MSVDMLVILAVLLTVTMFITREAMLGFPCVIFWALLGAYAYTESTVPWGDWQYYLFFASMVGMVPFCAYAAFGLREKRDSIGDEEMEQGDGTYIDESPRKGRLDKPGADEMRVGSEGESDGGDSPQVRRVRSRTQSRRDRAAVRRKEWE